MSEIRRQQLLAAESNLESIRFLLKDFKEGWEYKDTKEEAVPGSNLMFMRGEGTINACLEDVYLCSFALEDRPYWDKMFDSGKVHTASFRMLMFSGKWPSAARDFVILSSRSREPDGSYIVAGTSTTHEAAPEIRGVVRANIRTSGFVIRDATPSGSNLPVTSLTYIVQLDPGGWVPVYLANAVAINQPLCIAGIRTVTEARARTRESLIGTDPLFSAPSPSIVPSLSVIQVADELVMSSAPVSTSPSISLVENPEVDPVPTHLHPSESAISIINSTTLSIASSLRAASGAAEALVRIFHLQQDHIQRAHLLLSQYIEVEHRVRDAELHWDQRLRRIEGPLMDVDWLRAWRNVDWRASAAVAAVLLLWPIIANLGWKQIQTWIQRSRK